MFRELDGNKICVGGEVRERERDREREREREWAPQIERKEIMSDGKIK